MHKRKSGKEHTKSLTMVTPAERSGLGNEYCAFPFYSITPKNLEIKHSHLFHAQLLKTNE